MTFTLILFLAHGYPEVQTGLASESVCMAAGLQAWRRSELYGDFWCVPS